MESLGDRLIRKLNAASKTRPATKARSKPALPADDIRKRRAWPATVAARAPMTDAMRKALRIEGQASNLRTHGVSEPIHALAEATLQRYVAARPVGHIDTQDGFIAKARADAATKELARRALRTRVKGFRVLR